MGIALVLLGVTAASPDEQREGLVVQLSGTESGDVAAPRGARTRPRGE